MVLHKNKWDKKATRAHERKLQTNAGAQAVASEAELRKARRGAVPSTAQAGAATSGQGKVLGDKNGDSKVAPGTSEGVQEKECAKEGEIEVDSSENEERGKYSRRKIASNAWRYEEPEEDPYLKAEAERDASPEPDYVQMTVGKAQLKVDSSEDEALDDIDPDYNMDKFLIRDDVIDRSTKKGKVVHVDRKAFQDINEKVAKQQAAEEFRQRFAFRKGKSGNSKKDATVDFDEDGDVGDIDDFLEGLKLNAKTVSQTPQNSTDKAKSPIVSPPTGEGSLRREENDEDWLDEMLSSGRTRGPVTAERNHR